MPVEIEWDGVSLTKGAAAREEDGGWFVELEQPMPVGTTLVLAGDIQATVTVTRVHEGLGAGMVVKKADARASPTPPAAATDEPEAKDAGGGGEKKEKRKKRR